jgi:hypothetical protein
MASRRKRGPVAFRRRHSTVLALAMIDELNIIACTRHTGSAPLTTRLRHQQL